MYSPDAHVSLAYTPRDHFLPLHQRKTRWCLVVAHRRAGKTFALINDLILGALEVTLPNPRLAFAAPTYAQAQRIAWDYLKRQAQPFLEKRPNETELCVQLVGDRKIYLIGMDNPDSIRGLYLDGAVLDEFGFARPSAYTQIILPALSDRRGWAVLSSTPNGQNHFYDQYQLAVTRPETWTTLFLPHSVTHVIPPEEVAMLQAAMSEEEFAQEFDCSFTASILGSIYGRLINSLESKGQLGSAHYDPSRPVQIAFDLGYSDATALWVFQPSMDGIAILQYHENTRQPVDYYIEYIRSQSYAVSDIFLPHDARARTLVTGRSILDQFLRAFPNRVRIAPKLAIADGIAAVRQLLPSCHFSSGCADGIRCLRQYQYRYDEVNQCFSTAPLHDWASNGADAFRTLAVVTRPAHLLPPVETQPDLPKEDALCLHNLFTQRDLLNPFSRRI
jgi:phage terminase large subunit